MKTRYLGKEKFVVALGLGCKDEFCLWRWKRRRR